jgi:hypothetical protein
MPATTRPNTAKPWPSAFACAAEIERFLIADADEDVAARAVSGPAARHRHGAVHVRQAGDARALERNGGVALDARAWIDAALNDLDR